MFDVHLGTANLLICLKVLASVLGIVYNRIADTIRDICHCLDLQVAQKGFAAS